MLALLWLGTDWHMLCFTRYRGGGNFCHCFVASSFKYLCAKNYQNRTWFDSNWKNEKGAAFAPQCSWRTTWDWTKTWPTHHQHTALTTTTIPAALSPLSTTWMTTSTTTTISSSSSASLLACITKTTGSQQSPELSALSRVFSRPKQAYPAFSRNNIEKLCIIMADDV